MVSVEQLSGGTPGSTARQGPSAVRNLFRRHRARRHQGFAPDSGEDAGATGAAGATEDIKKRRDDGPLAGVAL